MKRVSRSLVIGLASLLAGVLAGTVASSPCYNPRAADIFSSLPCGDAIYWAVCGLGEVTARVAANHGLIEKHDEMQWDLVVVTVTFLLWFCIGSAACFWGMRWANRGILGTNRHDG